MFIYVYILYFQSIFYRQLQYLFFSGARNPLCNWCFFKEKVFFCGKLSTTFWWPKTSSKKLLASAHSGGGSPFVCFAWPTLNAWSAACQGCSLNTWSLHEPHQTKNLQGKATWHVDKICEHQAKKKNIRLQQHYRVLWSHLPQPVCHLFNTGFLWFSLICSFFSHLWTRSNLLHHISTSTHENSVNKPAVLHLATEVHGFAWLFWYGWICKLTRDACEQRFLSLFVDMVHMLMGLILMLMQVCLYSQAKFFAEV